MKIIALKRYPTGYTGFIEDNVSYIFFKFPRKGKLKKLLKYDKECFMNYQQFLGGITKIFRRSFFLEDPVVLETITIADLDTIHRHISRR